MDRRRSMACCLVALLVLGGCLSGGAPGQSRSPTPVSSPAPTPTPTLTPTPTTAASTPDATASPSRATDGAVTTGRASNQPDPDKAIRLVNEWNRSVEMRVRVVRAATNETVHEGTYELGAGAERSVYDTAAADPDGIEAFTVVLTARNATERVTVETNACYGDVYGTVREDGGVYLYYAIC